MEKMRRSRVRWLVLSGVVLLSSDAFAQGYPQKPVRIVVPSAAGGSTDTISRVVAQKLAGDIGVTVVVENRPGGGGNLGADVVAKSPPDGYTLVMVYAGHAVNVTLYPKLAYDLVKDFDPVIHVCMVASMLVVHPSLPVKSVKELIAFAKANPGALNYASSGTGNISHLAGELFRSLTGVKIVHVPYRGTGPALIDVLGGQVPMMFPNMPGTMQHVQSGRLRVLGVNSEKRSALLPDVPTVAEAGVRGFEASTWFGLLAPAGTPREVIVRLNAATARVLNTADVNERFVSEGAVAAGGPPERFGALLKTEIEKWGKVVRTAGVRVE
jgi:tripartite-type tricarboxylate transporter receptor subunit TctC